MGQTNAPRFLSEIFSQIERSEGSREAALAALAAHLDADRLQPFVRGAVTVGERSNVLTVGRISWRTFKIEPEQDRAIGYALCRYPGRTPKLKVTEKVVLGPILFHAGDVDHWWPAPQQNHKTGRRKGTGFQKADDLIVEKMHELITSGLASSRTGAAKRVVAEAQGGGTEDSKIKRLRDRYKERHGE